MAFDIHLRARLELAGVPEDSPFPKEENPLEVWQVSVQAWLCGAHKGLSCRVKCVVEKKQ